MLLEKLGNCFSVSLSFSVQHSVSYSLCLSLTLRVCHVCAWVLFSFRFPRVNFVLFTCVYIINIYIYTFTHSRVFHRNTPRPSRLVRSRHQPTAESSWPSCVLVVRTKCTMPRSARTRCRIVTRMGKKMEKSNAVASPHSSENVETFPRTTNRACDRAEVCVPLRTRARSWLDDATVVYAFFRFGTDLTDAYFGRGTDGRNPPIRNNDVLRVI